MKIFWSDSRKTMAVEQFSSRFAPSRRCEQQIRESLSGGSPFKLDVPLIGWSPYLKSFPSFHATIPRCREERHRSKRGARPCRHCGSDKHWDYECQYARKEAKNIRADLALAPEEYVRSQEEYDSLCYDTDSSDDEDPRERRGGKTH